MKATLRRIAGAIAALLLAFCPVTAFAAEASLPDDVEVSPETGGNTTFGIMELSPWHTLNVTVQDRDTNELLPGVTVQLFQGNSSTPITGSGGSAFVTDQDGKIRFKLSDDATIEYHIVVEHAGFEKYTGTNFTLPDKENTQTIELTPLYFTVRYFAMANGCIGEKRPPLSPRPCRIPTIVLTPGF